MGIEIPNFGQGHHGGIPSAAELQWRASVERAALETRYGDDAFPAAGTINFQALPVSRGESMAESIQNERDWYEARSD